MDEEMDEEFDDDVEKRFGCAECGHTFCMECEEDMIPKFCPFCASPVYIRDVDEDDEYCDDEEDNGFHL